MSGNMDKEKSKTPTTIKIAAKDASQRGSGGQADPGPGDPNAMPSEMPEPVSIPAPPSPSELVVKSVDSRMIKTINNPVSLSKSKGGSASTALKSYKTLSGPKSYDEEAPREPTSSKALSSMKSTGHLSTDGIHSAKTGSHLSAKFGGKSVHGSRSGGSGGSGVRSGSGGPGVSSGPTALDGPDQSGQAGASGRAGASGGTGPSGGYDPSIGGMSAVKTIDGAGGGGVSGASASQAMQDDSQAADGQEQDVETVGETEVEHPPSPSPSPGPSGASSPASGGIDTAPVSSGGGMSKMGPKTSSLKSKVKSDTGSDASSASVGVGKKKKKKKKSKFRYHKRVTVRTHGKTSPTSVMDKVNKKDHKAGITPSSIGEMDPEELLKRAGIKSDKKTHWRVRLRQTKRTTKDGKTTTQTRVAYRDSEGNKRIKTSSTPDCQKCGKKLEECRCDE